ncbi:MAG: cysteine desulfurase [bacterium]|nr:cysteine desulfurase [bacterium]
MRGETLLAGSLRADFPIFEHKVKGRDLIYLDSAASAQKPQVVLDTLHRFYAEGYANIHRGVYHLSGEATQIYEGTREKVRRFIGAAETREIVFVRGTTEGINLLAHSFGKPRVGEGDEVLVTEMEHHSNIVPWQLLCEEKGARLVVAPMDDRGQLDLDAYTALLGPRTKLAALGHVSNALGTVNPIKEMIRLAHERDIPVVVDGAQALPHLPVDVRDLDADFYVFSGHKLYGPTGIGIVYGKSDLLADMPPYQGGGDMIRSVTFEKTSYAPPPGRFEAGTPDIAGAIGLGAAIYYLESIGFDAVMAHERELTAYGEGVLGEIEGLKMIGTATDKVGVFSFTIDGVHPHDLGTILDGDGICIRAGHHCAQPVMDHFGLPATARASLGLYNDKSDLDALVVGLRKCKELFGA